MQTLSRHSKNYEDETHDGATNTDADRQFHLTFHGHPHGRDVLSCIGLWKVKSRQNQIDQDDAHTTIGRRIRPMNGFGM
jgi:hypothetical protein